MRHNRFNQVAYRVLLLLQWLIEAPLSFEGINQRFEAEAGVERRISLDTLGLYLNTLRAVGCQITRPTPTNGGLYHLTHHPFHPWIAPTDLDILQTSLVQAESDLDPLDWIHLVAWLKTYVEGTANPDREELSRDLLYRLRTQDFTPQRPLLETLLSACQTQISVTLTYHSPVHGEETLVFLPQRVLLRHGQLYLSGQQLQPERGPSLLRLDRIQMCHEAVPTPATTVEKPASIVAVLRYPGPVTHYEPLGWEESITPDPDHPEMTRITATAEDWFSMKQVVLSSGVAFQVIAPDAFRQDLHDTLHAMSRCYA